jgi:nucleoside-diphosphate-sugar epimerase
MTSTKILLAGATGVVGRRLVPLLVGGGYNVFGMTRSQAKAASIMAAGAEPIVLDAFDAAAVRATMLRLKPDVIVHQLTDLALVNDAATRDEALARNARLRIEGTRNLVDAALACGAKRMVAQSIAWVYAAGREPHAESDPLDLKAEGTRANTVEAVATLERLVTQSPGLDGVVLRYGQFYGPGTGVESAAGKPSALHVDAAAYAALLAVDRGAPGIYNVAEPSWQITGDKVRRELGWDAAFRLRS